MTAGASRARRMASGLAMLLATAPAASALSQVLEIDSGGGLTTYDRPMVFTAAGASAIVPRRVTPAVSVTALTGWAKLDAEALNHGLPPSLLRAVVWQESRGRSTAVSRKGALGIMQLMPATAAALGVDPRDPADNLRGGAIYLRRQLDRFGSVPLALAAYNAGPGAVARFGGIPPFRETRAYVASIMANWQPEPAAPTLSLQTGNSPS